MGFNKEEAKNDKANASKKNNSIKVNKEINNDPLDKKKNLARIKTKDSFDKILENDRKRRANEVARSYERLLNIKDMIANLSEDHVSDGDIRNIISLIDKELERCTLRMEFIGNSNNDELKEEANLFSEFNQLNSELFKKVSLCMPFDSFLYCDDNDREKILSEFFDKLDKDIKLMEYDDIDFSSEAKNIIKEKHNILSNNLIEILEEKLNVHFSDNQKITLKNDFSKIASKVNEERMNEMINECNKIKEVKNLKLVSRPSYKNFISKSELKSGDDSHKISTIRVDFVNYITLNKSEKINAISDNLQVQFTSIKEILEEEREEYSKKMKLLFALILLSGAAVTFNPMLAATGVIALGSAAAYMQTKVIMAANKINKIDDEVKCINDKKSEIVNETYEKLEETSNELMKDEEYSHIAKEYIKKKKEAKRLDEMKKKIEAQMRQTIIENLDKLSSEKQDKIAHKVKDKLYEKANSKSKENDKDVSIDVQIEL